MEDLPSLPLSRTQSRASSALSSSPELNESHLYIRDFVRETRHNLNFTATQLPILDDRQLSELSDGETILVPLSCSALNALASMARQLDTITTQLGTIQAAVHRAPTWEGLQGVLEPINTALRDLSHRVTAPPPPRAGPHPASCSPDRCYHTASSCPCSHSAYHSSVWYNRTSTTEGQSESPSPRERPLILLRLRHTQV